MENSLSNNNYLESLVEQIKEIDTTELNDDVSEDAVSTVIEDQKVYFWIRLFLKEEDPNLKIGDDIIIKWNHSGEELITKFFAWGKKGFEKDLKDNITNYNPEDDKKVLSLMIDEKSVNYNEDIPFIRTLFKTGRHYEYQLVKRSELLFINNRNGMILDYFDCDF
jgi:hypothetical protein